ncbi:aldose 1-epimerase family protein [Halpernia frigidisoli]|uniref:Galactose mutarotase n=1 Tax=Halpernia frigidisoli TaxID=1125876 RepID=A0A1I3DWB1_9FLAO|nr:aldose 1-epimerase family protein [Halpernia frigidisoli]SFH90923.1 Galactose mutarotase [Halpernia frigidisoli]
MKTTIKNSFLTATILHKGAELETLIKDGKNVIWTIDKSFWNKTSPILFPIVGGLKDGKYNYLDESYSLSRHGFARDHDFELISKTDDSAVFSLKYSEETLKIYPFKFELQITNELFESQLYIIYKILNLDNDKMYFSLGAHPAFAIDGNFEEYELEFDNNNSLISHQLDNELLSGKTVDINLKTNLLPLKYELFENDALVFKNSSTSNLTLFKDKKPQISVHFKDFPYLGIWTKKGVPFLCIEPWLGIADSQTSTGNLTEKEGIRKLEGNAEVEKSFSIEVF